MATILVVDDEPLVREALSLALGNNGHRVLCASDGAAALPMIRAERPDAVVLDLNMPAMNGLTVLRAMRDDPATRATPVLLLTGAGDKASIVQAAKLGVHSYMLKASFSLKQLLERVELAVAQGKAKPLPPRAQREKAASPAPVATCRPPATTKAQCGRIEDVPQLLTRAACVERTKLSMAGKSLSGIVAQVLCMAASPSSDLKELAGLISRDPMLSARVLHTANSVAFTTTGKQIYTIPEAVQRLGLANIRDIAAAAGVFDALPAGAATGFDPVRCWQHSFAVATLCQQLASVTHPDRAGMAYLVGLCHDLGDILFHTHFGKEYAELLEARAQTGLPSEELEERVLGMRRGELTGQILAHLGLPAAIRAPIEAYHQVGQSSTAGEAAEALRRVLRLADLYAHGMMLAAGGTAAVAPFTGGECKRAVGQENPKPPEADTLRAHILALTGMFAGSSAEQLRRALTPLHPKTPASVWLARHPTLSAFDPVEAAMRSLCERSDVSDRLPSPHELGASSHLVVVAPASSTAGFDAASIGRATSGRHETLRVLWLVNKASTVEAATHPRLSPVQAPTNLDALAAFLAAP